MFISPEYKVRIITTDEDGWQKGVAEVFRWSEAEGGWLHVADVPSDADAVELAILVPLAKLTEVDESPSP